MTISRPAVRDGKKGHIVQVAPRQGYERWVPDEYPGARKRGKRDRD